MAIIHKPGLGSIPHYSHSPVILILSIHTRETKTLCIHGVLRAVHLQ